jgi:Putative adhesin
MTFMSDTGGSGYTTGSRRPSAPMRMTPARWAVLALAVPVALALIGWTGFGIVALLAKGSYPFSFPVAVQHGQVNANLNVGNITLRQVPGRTARVTGTVQYGLFRPGITSSATPGGDSVGVNCDGINDNCNVNATLDVPARTPVTLSSDGGDIAVSGFASNLALSAGGGNLTVSNLTSTTLLLDTGGGDVTASGLSGAIQIGTEGGNISANGLAGPTMRLDTGGGDLNGSGFTGDLTVSTSGGNVDANAVTSQHTYVQSGGGDVTLVFTKPPQNLQIGASGGNVNVILPSGGTRYDISANAQGGNLNIPSTLTSSTSHNTITINSGGGDITISQAG